MQSQILSYQPGGVLGNAWSQSVVRHAVSLIQHDKAVSPKHYHVVLYRRLGQTKSFCQLSEVHFPVDKQAKYTKASLISEGQKVPQKLVAGSQSIGWHHL